MGDLARIHIPTDEGGDKYGTIYNTHRMLRAIEDAGYEIALRTAGGDSDNPVFIVRKTDDE